ncbi:MAG: c-type cytochrome [Pseudomonadota bacterium]
MRSPLIALFGLVVGCGAGAPDAEADTVSEPSEASVSEAAHDALADAASDKAPDPIAVALSQPPISMAAAQYEVNPRRGRILFVTKGCVLCHAANDVGGRAAPPFYPPTADAGGTAVDPLAFSSRMWSGAAAMVSLQRLELGYQVQLDGQDIADLAAFAASPDEQKLVTLESLPVGFENWFVDARFWDNEEWGEYLERGEFPDLGEFPDETDFDRP